MNINAKTIEQLQSVLSKYKEVHGTVAEVNQQSINRPNCGQAGCRGFCSLGCSGSCEHSCSGYNHM